jgi:hypothetical protein
MALHSIRTSWPWLRHVCADGGHAGPKLCDALEGKGGWRVEIIKRNAPLEVSPSCRGAGF